MGDEPGPPLKKRRGGVQQRLQASALENAPSTSKLATHLLEEFALGKKSPQECQRLASLAVKDMTAAGVLLEIIPVDLRKLSELGSGGRHLNNCYRDIMRMTCRIPSIPMPFSVNIPTKQGDETAGILLPHVMFASMYHHYRAAFGQYIMPGGEDALQEFWTTGKRMPQLANHPILRRANFEARCVPIALHGDEVPTVGRGKVWCKLSLLLSWFSVMAVGVPTLQAMNLIWAHAPQCAVEGPDGTVAVFMRIMKWSFSALFAGTWPRRDWRGVAYEPADANRAGEPLADGYFACLIGLCGDLDYCAKFLGHPRWSSHSEPCGLCRATFRGPLTWLNFSENAPWEGTQWTPETWARRPNRSTCPLFEMPGFTSIAVLPDYMHNKYLGYAQYLFGSVFWLLCFVHMAAAPLQNLRTLANFIMSFQNRHRPRHGERYPARTLRKLTMFVKKRDFPKLRGKAGQIRGLGDAMIAMWKRYGDLHTRDGIRIKLLLEPSLQCDEILDSHSPADGYWALPPPNAAELVRKQRLLGQLYVQLSESYAAQEVRVFNMSAKLHYCLHSALWADKLHPHLVWRWRGEDLMGRISTLISSCVSGRTDVSATLKAAEKYGLACHYMWSAADGPRRLEGR